MTSLGVIFLLLGFLLIVDDIDDWFSFINPFFLAPFFCGLFFLTPAMFAMIRKQKNAVGLKAQSHQYQQERSESQPPVDRRVENTVMGIFGTMALIMAVIAVVFVIVVLYIAVYILTWISENGFPLFGGW